MKTDEQLIKEMDEYVEACGTLSPEATEAICGKWRGDNLGDALRNKVPKK